MYAGFVRITLGIVLSYVTTGFAVVETCVFVLALALLAGALIVLVLLVIFDDKPVFKSVLTLLVSFVVAADVAFTFKISAKANSKKTEHIDFRLILSPPSSICQKVYFLTLL